MSIENQLYTADQIRELDNIAITVDGIPGLVLMRRAAEASAQKILEHWPDVSVVIVFCGSGNNAGDGYILAGLLSQRGVQVNVVAVGSTEKLGTDATEAFNFCQQSGVVWMTLDEIEEKHLTDEVSPSADSVMDSTIVVDALLGIGITGEPRPDYVRAIHWINRMKFPVVALDIPTGLSADSGSFKGSCIKADMTISFVGWKRGTMTADGCEVVGELVLDTLGIANETLVKVKSKVRRLNLTDLLTRIPKRNRNAHKGTFGHLLVVGGDTSMPGAPTMAAEAALRSGSGLVTIATREGHRSAIISRLPEVMVKAVEKRDDLLQILEQVDAVVVGPGLGKGSWSRSLLEAVLGCDKPVVVDADGLNLLAEFENVEPRENWILTPHPGEAARLLQTDRPELDAAAIQSDRFAAIEALHQKFGGTILLKGAGTLIVSADALSLDSGKKEKNKEIRLCPYGNPGMATAGMGDVLSGVVGGLLAQKHQPGFASELGACLHSRAADICVDEHGEGGLMATDLIPVIRRLMNKRQS